MAILQNVWIKPNVNDLQKTLSVGKRSKIWTVHQDIYCLLWNLNIHSRFHKSLPMDIILIHINPVHTLAL